MHAYREDVSLRLSESNPGISSMIGSIVMSQTNPESELTAQPHRYTVHDYIPYGVTTRLRNHDKLAGDAVVYGAAAYRRYVQTPNGAAGSLAYNSCKLEM